MRSMSGIQRLTVFLTLLWVGFWFIAFLVDGGTFNWSGFFLFGIVPVVVLLGIPWGVWWVVAGFRAQRKGLKGG